MASSEDDFDGEDVQLLIMAVQTYRNWFTTGSVTLSPADVENIGREDAKRNHDAVIKALSPHQVGILHRLNQIEQKLFKAGR